MTYSVMVDGSVLPGFDRAVVVAQLAKLIGRSEEMAGRLLEGTPRKVRSNVDQATAMRYVESLRRIGVACHTEESMLPLDIDATPAATATRASKAPPAPTSRGLNEKYCSACGNIVHKEAELCPKCGTHLRASTRKTPPPAQIVTFNRGRRTAALLAIFLGWIGVHKFYLGKASGIWYLLFSWTLIPLLLGLVDGIGYLRMSDATFARQNGGVTMGGARGAAQSSPVSAKGIFLLLGLALLVGLVAMTLGRREIATRPALTTIGLGVKAPAAVSDLRPVIFVSRTKPTALGHVQTRHGSVAVSGQYAQDSDKVIISFSPAVPLDNDAPRFFSELAELIYGVRPSSSIQDSADGTGIIVGDPPKQFVLVNVKRGNNIVGAGMSPRY